MTGPEDTDADAASESRTRQFAEAWQALDRAHEIRLELNATWSHLLDQQIFDFFANTDRDGSGDIRVVATWSQSDRQSLRDKSMHFAEAIQESLDWTVVAAARLVAGVLVHPEQGEVRFPLEATPEGFLRQYETGDLAGLRPDQIRLIEQYQPFNTGGRGSHQLIRESMSFLLAVEDAVSTDHLEVAAWVHSAQPQVRVDPPCSVAAISPEPDGFLFDTKTIATYRIEGYADLEHDSRPVVETNPMVAIDLVTNVEPWPAEPDDTLGRRTFRLIVTTKYLIEAFERSMGLRAALFDAPAFPDPADWSEDDTANWLSFDTEDAWSRGAMEALDQSDIGLVTVQNEDEVTLLVRANGAVFARPVPRASALDPRLPQGTAAEHATSSIASQWGLADFVFPSVTRRTASGVRERGDAIVYFGNQGIVLQVKSRVGMADVESKERNWILKNVAKAASQAAGTVRQMRMSEHELLNQRNRLVKIDKDSVDWIGVVIVDHPHIPEDIGPISECRGLPIVALMRRDWDFLFEQLKSASAVNQYLRRVAGDPWILGREHQRYFELAIADAEAEPGAMSWTLPEGARRVSHPLLPRRPISETNPGHVTFHMILNDIANAATEAPQNQLIEILAALDGIPVVAQGDVGSLLLRHLRNSDRVALGTTRWESRRHLTSDRHQFIFTVCNTVSDRHKDAFRSRVELIQHQMEQRLPTGTSSRTIGVLITPRRDGIRYWDTTLIVANAPIGLTEEELSAYEEFWPASELPETPS